MKYQESRQFRLPNINIFNMTEPQEIAFAEAFLLLEKHFDHVLIATRDKHPAGGIMRADCNICWYGGLEVGEYLARQSAKRIDGSHKDRRPPIVSKEVMDSAMTKITALEQAEKAATAPTRGKVARK